MSATAKPAPIADVDNIDHDILPDLVGYHLRRAQVKVFDHFTKAIGTLQVTPGQFGVLTLIGANPGLTQSALARAVGIERSTMVAVIDGLQKRKLVERRPSPVDRRSYSLVLTGGGEALLAQLRPLVKKQDEDMVASLSADEKATLLDLLKRLSA